MGVLIYVFGIYKLHRRLAYSSFPRVKALLSYRSFRRPVRRLSLFFDDFVSKFSIPLSVRGDWQPKDLWSDAKILEMTTENLAVVSPSPTDRQRRLDAAQNPKGNPIISEAYGRKERDCCLQSQCQSGWRITIGVSLFTSLHPLPSPQTCATGWINRVKEINI